MGYETRTYDRWIDDFLILINAAHIHQLGVFLSVLNWVDGMDGKFAGFQSAGVLPIF